MCKTIDDYRDIVFHTVQSQGTFINRSCVRDKSSLGWLTEDTFVKYFPVPF